MKPEQSKRMIIVGTFIFLALLILLAGMLVMGNQRNILAKSVELRAVFNDVNGLLVGNNVWISGVKIGTVKKIKLCKGSQVEVLMSIEQRSLVFINKNAKAKISTDGLIGNKIVVIYGGTPQSPHVQNRDVLYVEKAMTTEEILNTLQENNRNLLAITNSFKMIAKRIVEGEGTIGKLLKDETIINDLQSTVATLKRASLYTQTLTGNLAVYSSKLQAKGTLANDLVTDTSIFNVLRTTVFQIKEVSTTANMVAANLKDVSDNLKNISYKIDSSSGLVGTMISDKEVVANLKATLKNLQSSTEKLNENMEALQHSFLLRGYFKEKEKQESTKKNNSNKTVKAP